MEQFISDPKDRVDEVIEKYADMVRRICFVQLKNKADVEDIFQEVFLKLIQNNIAFESDEHEKAWLCRVTLNKCKDLHKSSWVKTTCSIDEAKEMYDFSEHSDLMDVVLRLPIKHKTLIYLHYYEGYTVPQISQITGENQNTIYTKLRRAKQQLKSIIIEEDIL